MGLKNGELLQRAETSGFEVFLTGDRNLEFQQNLQDFKLIFVVLVAASNALEDLLPLVPSALLEIAQAVAGRLVRVEAT